MRRMTLDIVALALILASLLSIAPVTYAGRPAGNIVDVKFSASSFLDHVPRGTKVSVTVTAKNTGDVKYKFWVGITFMDMEGKLYDINPKSVTLSPGGPGKVTFTWNVDRSAAPGPMSLGAGLWQGYDGRYMTGELFDMWGWAQVAILY